MTALNNRGNGNGLAAAEGAFANKIAHSLGARDVDDLAQKLGFQDAQEMADYYGFKNIYTFFSSPGNDDRYAEIENRFLADNKRQHA